MIGFYNHQNCPVRDKNIDKRLQNHYFIPYGIKIGFIMSISQKNTHPKFGRIDNAKDLGALVRAFRKSQGLTLEKVSGLTTLSIRFLSELERGKETAELGKVLSILGKLGLEVTLQPRQYTDKDISALWYTPPTRCAWGTDDPLYIAYHDKEWGKPIKDDRLLFEFLILEGMQAGLSWITILKKRENFRKAFDNFDPTKIAKYNAKKCTSLLQDAGIIRNKLKIQAAIGNAKAYLKIKQEFGSFSDYIWGFVSDTPLQNAWATVKEIPAKTEISDCMSKDLKKRGFKFVGSTICYAFMQAVGMVNDHTMDCFCYAKY